jgi:hypothetical protein
LGSLGIRALILVLKFFLASLSEVLNLGQRLRSQLTLSPSNGAHGYAMLNELDEPALIEVIEGNHHTLPIISTSPNT